MNTTQNVSQFLNSLPNINKKIIEYSLKDNNNKEYKEEKVYNTEWRVAFVDKRKMKFRGENHKIQCFVTFGRAFVRMDKVL